MLTTTRPASSPHPFYVFATIGLAVFLIGVLACPHATPRFVAESVLAARALQPDTPVDVLTDAVSNVANELSSSGAVPGKRFPKNQTDIEVSWQLERSRINSEVYCSLRHVGRDPVAVRESHEALAQILLAHLQHTKLPQLPPDQQSSATSNRWSTAVIKTFRECLQDNSTKYSHPEVLSGEKPTSDPVATSAGRPWEDPETMVLLQRRLETLSCRLFPQANNRCVAWQVRESALRLTRDQSVSPSQVVSMGIPACILGALAAWWSAVVSSEDRTRPPSVRDAALQLDVPILATLGKLAERQRTWRVTPDSRKMLAMLRNTLRLGELTLIAVLLLTSLHITRSETFRLIFTQNPLTALRASLTKEIWNLSQIQYLEKSHRTP